MCSRTLLRQRAVRGSWQTRSDSLLVQLERDVGSADVAMVSEGQLYVPSARRLPLGMHSVSQHLERLLRDKGVLVPDASALSVLRNAVIRVADSAEEARELLSKVLPLISMLLRRTCVGPNLSALGSKASSRAVGQRVLWHAGCREQQPLQRRTPCRTGRASLWAVRALSWLRPW